MKARVSWSIVLLFLLGGSAAAAPAADDPAVTGGGPVLSLSDLVGMVLAHNPHLVLVQRVREQAEAGIVSAAALPNPRLELQDGQLRPNNMPTSPGSIGGWAVSQFIENPAMREARIEAARHGYRSTATQLSTARAETVAQVRLRAYELLLRIEESRAAAAELRLLEQTRERVRVRVDSGEAPRYEIIKAEAELISAHQRGQTAQMAVQQARIRLNQLANGRLPTDWSLQSALDEAPVLAPSGRLREMLLADNPELQTLRIELERQHARVREAGHSRWPGVELRYTEMREPDNRQSVLGASIQLPLFDQRRGPMAEADAELQRARTRLEGRQTELLLQLDAAMMTLDMARLRVEALASGAVRDAEAAVRVAQAAYRFGERGILDVLDAQRVLRSVRADLLQARFQQQAAAIEIDLLTGRDAIAQP